MLLIVGNLMLKLFQKNYYYKVKNKKQTHPIERNNFRQRHWFARFRRKTCVVSRSLQMVDLTMALFAKFHCNSTFSFSSLFT